MEISGLETLNQQLFMNLEECTSQRVYRFLLLNRLPVSFIGTDKRIKNFKREILQRAWIHFLHLLYLEDRFRNILTLIHNQHLQ